MKKFFMKLTAIAVMPMLLAACTKDEVNPTPTNGGKEGEIELILKNESVADGTRAFGSGTTESWEKSISSAVLIVYNTSGTQILRRVLTAAEVNGSTTTPIKFVLPGVSADASCDFYVVINRNIADNITTKAKLLEELESDIASYNGTYANVTTKAQYGAFAGHPKLGAADYKLSCHGLHQRGAYTFCMCPGGTVVAAASEKGGVIVNGMSTLARDGENANSALLVGIDPVDFPSEHPLAGMYYQREIEQNAFALGGGDYRAPAQLVGDFLADRESRALGNVQPTCPTGVTLTNLRYCLPDKVRTTMQAAITEMDKRLHGFALPDAVLTAPETRSSSSVRILRDEFCQCNLRGVYPCGEGAGYAGGIVSAAVDGIKCAHAVLADAH